MKKRKALLLFGGVSNEYEVSLRSVCCLRENIDTDRFDPVLVGITRDGRWRLFEGELSEILADTWETRSVPAILSPDRGMRGLLVFRRSGVVSVPVDVIFPGVHGQNCEDGALQGLLELSGVPYVGSGVASSAVCFDKELTHIVMERCEVPMAGWDCVLAGADLEAETDRLVKYMGLPLFVKPANSGSSVGASRAGTREELLKGLQNALMHDRKALVEELVEGQEVECAVLGNHSYFAPLVGEIACDDGFYDYESKYINDTAGLYIPANLEPSAAERVRELAVRVYRALGCRGLARVDFFVKKDQTVLLNELNTLPGFTSISMYPKLMEAAGVPVKSLISKLLDLAVERRAEGMANG